MEKKLTSIPPDKGVCDVFCAWQSEKHRLWCDLQQYPVVDKSKMFTKIIVK